MASFNITESARVWRSGSVYIPDDDLIEIVNDYLDEDSDNSIEDDALSERIREYVYEHEYDDYTLDTDDEESDGFEYENICSEVDDFLRDKYREKFEESDNGYEDLGEY
jgi:hypothetical protein